MPKVNQTEMHKILSKYQISLFQQEIEFMLNNPSIPNVTYWTLKITKLYTFMMLWPWPLTHGL